MNYRVSLNFTFFEWSVDPVDKPVDLSVKIFNNSGPRAALCCIVEKKEDVEIAKQKILEWLDNRKVFGVD